MQKDLGGRYSKLAMGDVQTLVQLESPPCCSQYCRRQSYPRCKDWSRSGGEEVAGDGHSVWGDTGDYRVLIYILYVIFSHFFCNLFGFYLVLVYGTSTTAFSIMMYLTPRVSGTYSSRPVLIYKWTTIGSLKTRVKIPNEYQLLGFCAIWYFK